MKNWRRYSLIWTEVQKHSSLVDLIKSSIQNFQKATWTERHLKKAVEHISQDVIQTTKIKILVQL